MTLLSRLTLATGLLLAAGTAFAANDTPGRHLEDHRR